MTLGIISLCIAIFAILTGIYLYYFMGQILMFVMPILILTYGIVGIVKDKVVAMAIVGLNLGIVYIFIMIVFYLMHYMIYYPYI